MSSSGIDDVMFFCF